MAVIRQNILNDATARDSFIRGVKLLKQEAPATHPTPARLGLSGPNFPISTYDLFVLWHVVAMSTPTPTGQNIRNAAHSGPAFLPWHRFMLMIFESHLQRVLGDQQFGLPYWDWVADGELQPPDQLTSPIWQENCLGGDGEPVTSGPFAYNVQDPSSWRVWIAFDPTSGNLVRLPEPGRGLNRNFAEIDASNLPNNLPNRANITDALSDPSYDADPWDMFSQTFRNRLEGWFPNPSNPHLHNRVHVWVGGDMLPATSPNDPVFYLNHCNVDRLWEAWMQQQGPNYLPDQTASSDLFRHRIDDEMLAFLSSPLTPRDVLNVASIYSYDTLA